MTEEMLMIANTHDEAKADNPALRAKPTTCTKGIEWHIQQKKWDLSHERESSEQFVWYGETEMQLCRWAMMPSIQADWSQDEVI